MKKLLLILLFILLITSKSYAQMGSADDLFEIGGNARAIGLGRTYVALGDDITSTYFNPAGLANLKSFSVTSTSVNFMGDIAYFNFSFASPYILKNATLGAGYAGVNTMVTITKLDPSGRPVPIGTTNYKSYILFLSLARKLQNLSLGTNLKIFTQSYGSLPSQYSGKGNASGFNFDVGLQYNPSQVLTLGLSWQNILPQNYGGLNWSTGQRETINSIIRGGALLNLMNSRFKIAADGEYSYKCLPIHIGIELWPVDSLALRFGLDQSVGSVGANKVGTYSSLTGGVGVRLFGVAIDYAYHPYFGENESTTHYISFAYTLPQLKIKPLQPPNPQPR